MRRIRLTESQFNQLVAKCVKQALSETDRKGYIGANGNMQQPSKFSMKSGKSNGSYKGSLYDKLNKQLNSKKGKELDEEDEFDMMENRKRK